MTDLFSADDLAELATQLTEQLGVEVAVAPSTKVIYQAPWQERVFTAKPSGNDHLNTGTSEFQVNIISDGTNTVVQVIDHLDSVVGEGFARRRKGDPRNELLGNTLAAARAFADAANFYAGVAEELLER